MLTEQSLRAQSFDGVMKATARASSISKAILDMPKASVLHARVLSRHQHACNVELAEKRGPCSDRTQVITLVDDAIGNGPLNIVVNDLLAVRASDLQYNEISFSKTHLRFGGIDVSLIDAAAWDPRPDWQRLRDTCMLPAKHLERLLKAGRRHAPPGSLLELLQPVSLRPRAGAIDQSLFSAFSRILRGMQTGGRASLRDGAASLAGLGNGLTPAGDDFLLGIMLFVWLSTDSATTICQPLVYAAKQRTTRLSACLLMQAALGNCSSGWHSLFESMAADDAVFEQSVATLLSYGHTSGGDALAGFIWAGHNEHLGLIT